MGLKYSTEQGEIRHERPETGSILGYLFGNALPGKVIIVFKTSTKAIYTSQTTGYKQLVDLFVIRSYKKGSDLKARCLLQIDCFYHAVVFHYLSRDLFPLV